jgi:hypothetical protein
MKLGIFLRVWAFVVLILDVHAATKWPTKLWNVEPEIVDLKMSLNVMSHSNLIDTMSIIASSSRVEVCKSVSRSKIAVLPKDTNDEQLEYYDDDIFNNK